MERGANASDIVGNGDGLGLAMLQLPCSKGQLDRLEAFWQALGFAQVDMAARVKMVEMVDEGLVRCVGRVFRRDSLPKCVRLLSVLVLAQRNSPMCEVDNVEGAAGNA